MTTATSATGVLHGLETPAVVIDRERLEANIALAARIARDGGVALRPHIKTHKSIAIARRQLAAGAAGVTSAKSEEAEVFLRAGVPRLTLAHPLIAREKIDRLLGAAHDAGAEVSFICDSPTGVEAIAAAAAVARAVTPLYVKVNVGLNRCGVDSASDQALALAREIARRPSLRFAGLFSHAGNAYGAGSAQGVRTVAAKERATMTALAARLREAGIEVPAVSVGSTPTLLANDGFEGLTEIRPGNYVFLDLTQVTLGVARIEQVALSVVATVVSRNASYAIIDAGSKVLSSDRGPHGSDSLSGHGLAFPLDGSGLGLTVARLSEEHGFIEHGGAALPVGARVRIVPNHACVVANLARELHVVSADGGHELWPVDARALVR